MYSDMIYRVMIEKSKRFYSETYFIGRNFIWQEVHES